MIYVHILIFLLKQHIVIVHIHKFLFEITYFLNSQNNSIGCKANVVVEYTYFIQFFGCGLTKIRIKFSYTTYIKLDLMSKIC